MEENVSELPAVAELLVGIGVKIWEVFFLIQVGRGRGSENVTELPPRSTEDVCHFLYDASKYGMVVRTVEAPFFRRVVMARKAAEEDTADTSQKTLNGYPDLRKKATGNEHSPQSTAHPSSSLAAPVNTSALYRLLAEDLVLRLGPARSPSRAQTSGTRDGKGIVFVAHDGTVYPAGFLPVPLGNIRDTPLSTIYRESPLLKQIRSSAFSGRCGMCEFQDLCGGSRSRAYAHTGDALATDPACLYPA
ncbi:SPASM domain-containing protein [Alicyclobacillus sp. ALC3]|nr:SPASM domain-containing protein [Alicyclobacillus sp. ALC3]